MQPVLSNIWSTEVQSVGTKFHLQCNLPLSNYQPPWILSTHGWWLGSPVGRPWLMARLYHLAIASLPSWLRYFLTLRCMLQVWTDVTDSKAAKLLRHLRSQSLVGWPHYITVLVWTSLSLCRILFSRLCKTQTFELAFYIV